MLHHCVTNKTEKTMPGGRIVHRFSSKCGFRFRAKTSKFPCILVNCPNFPKSSPSCSHSRGLTSPNPQLSLVQGTPPVHRLWWKFS